LETAGAGAAVFGIACGLFLLGLAPVVPAFGFDVVAEVAVDECDGGVVAPGATEVGHLVRRFDLLGRGGIRGGGVPRDGVASQGRPVFFARP